MAIPKQKPANDLAYYLTLFTVKGHTTYRTHLSSHKDGFETDENMQAEVTSSTKHRIDRITGKITPVI